MSVVIHVGQCGNQLADAFWRLTADANDMSAPSTLVQKKSSSCARTSMTPPHAELPMLYADCFFHRRSRRARCILVDTEPKVIRSILRTSGAKSAWHFEPAHVHYEQSGRGNNWAMGYNFQTHQRNVLPSKSNVAAITLASAGVATSQKTKKKLLLATPPDATDKRELVDLVMESLRQEIEVLDTYRGTMVMHSLGGGTGAGLGCRVLETIRDVYPRSYLGAVSIAPSCLSGDTPLQNYNALFTLQHLQEHTDWIIYKENDELLKTALYWKNLGAVRAREVPSPQDDYDTRQVTLREMNALAATDVAGMIFPIVRKHADRGLVAVPLDMAKLTYDCCPLPTAKFLDTRTGVLREGKMHSKKTTSGALDPLFHAIRPSYGSQDVNDAGLDMLWRHTIQSFPRSTSASSAIGATVVVRHGKKLLDDGRSTGEYLKSLTSGLPQLYVDNSPQVVYSTLEPFHAYAGKASVTISLNTGHATASIRHYLDRGRRQFQARAYTHWYKQYGLEDADFDNALEQCTKIVQGYDELLHR